jgi:hypothetical protein
MFLSVAVFVFLMLNRNQLNVRVSWSCLYCLHVRGIRVGYVEKKLLSKDFSVRASMLKYRLSLELFLVVNWKKTVIETGKKQRV